jgi:peptide deformylase
MLVMYNPRIVDLSDEIISLDEACLSFPGLSAKVKRPNGLRVRYELPNGVTETKRFTGMTARVVQHENDHLNGVLFFDHISKLKLDMAIKKAANLGIHYNLQQLRK